MDFYSDNPIKNLEYIDSLNEKETKTYTLGYIQACQHIQEALSDSKRKFLEAALDNEEDGPRLMQFVTLLDSLDVSLSRRTRFLVGSTLDEKDSKASGSSRSVLDSKDSIE